MRCPACGSEESDHEICTQCHTSLAASEDSYDFEEKKAPAPPSPPPKRPGTPPSSSPKKTPPPSPKEGKHRPRPLHDLDLTLPEFDVQPLPKLKSRLEKSPSRPQASAKEEKSRLESDRRDSPQTGRQRKPTPPPSRPQKPPETKPSVSESSLDFSSYVLSIGTAALMALGGAKMPGMPSSQGSGPKDIAQGKELIDLLTMLDEKTEGNLTGPESELLKQTLRNLRVKLDQATKGS